MPPGKKLILKQVHHILEVLFYLISGRTGVTPVSWRMLRVWARMPWFEFRGWIRRHKMRKIAIVSTLIPPEIREITAKWEAAAPSNSVKRYRSHRIKETLFVIDVGRCVKEMLILGFELTAQTAGNRLYQGNIMLKFWLFLHTLKIVVNHKEPH